MSLRFWTTRHIVIFIWIDRTDQDFYEVDFVLGTIPAVFIGVESSGPMRAEDILNPAPTQNIEERMYLWQEFEKWYMIVSQDQEQFTTIKITCNNYKDNLQL